MKRLRRWPVFLGVLLAPVPAVGDDLAAQLGQVFDGPNYRQARWGSLVVDARTGQTLYARDPDRLFLPASTTKLYSCAAALIAFGAEHRFVTPVYQRGSIDKGNLHGDLILVASGDLTLGGRTDAKGRMAFRDNDHTYANGGNTSELTDTDPLAGLTALAKQVAAAGIRHVAGDVLIDDRLFARERGTGSGPDVLSPVLVNDNVIDLVITPGAKPGDAATVSQRPQTDYAQIDAHIGTGSESVKPNITIESPSPGRFIVRGRIPVKSKPLVRVCAMDDPAGYARALFIEALRREGVSVRAGLWRSSPTDLPEKESYSGLKRVALFTSPPLIEALKVTLKVSHNLYASTLPLLLAAQSGKRTLADGLRLQRKILADLGVDVETISFAGAAGGANADAVTPAATVQLLRAMAKRNDYSRFRDCLPVLGKDGTLAGIVPSDSPVYGKVQAKTGTLYWQDVLNDRFLLRSKALAGSLTTAKGRELFFVLFVNDVPLPIDEQPTREGKVLGKVCELIYRHAP